MKTFIELRDSFLFLLRQGLWGKKENPEDYFPISSIEWKTIYEWSRKHAIQGLVYDGMLLLPPALYPPKNILIPWMSNVDQWERITKSQEQVLGALKDLFNQEPKIPFELIKGLSIGQHFPQPLHHFSGDIDLCFPNQDSMQAAKERLNQVGVKVHEGNFYEACYRINQIEVENHGVLIDLHNPFILKSLRKWEQEEFGKGSYSLHLATSGNSVDTPSSIANHILVSTHILKHLLNGGIGLRQLCDAAILLKALSKEIDNDEFIHRCRQFGIYRWSQVLYALLVRYLGLSEEFLPFAITTSVNPQDLFDEIWESGNFGFYDGRKEVRPKEKWESRWYTVKQTRRQARIMFRYAPGESFWWPIVLTCKRLKSYLTIHERTDN